MSNDGELSVGGVVAIVLVSIILLIGAVCGCLIGGPQYRVWQQRLEGEAELARASYNRQVSVQEANAKMEAAKSLAQADIIRAEGAAKANVILGNSLKGNEDYLRYLWIQGLDSGKNAPSVIYVPTEAGLPILEAGKRAEVK
jgi:hypothetical protein